jgi:ADP-ribose pyrophosphatase
MIQEGSLSRREAAIASERVFEGRVVALRVDDVRLPNGRETKREVVEHKGAVAIVPLLPGNRVVLIRQWRYAVEEELLEIPAGTLEPGEEPLACAHRELAEETGYRAARLEPIASFYTSPGFTNERLHLFLATGLEPAAIASDEDELIEVVTIPWTEAMAMCADGRIVDGKTLFGLVAVKRAAEGAERRGGESACTQPSGGGP